MDDIRIVMANNMATEIYHTQLMKNEEVLGYLINDRGIKRETIISEKLGYAGPEIDICNLLKANDLPWEHMATVDGDKDYFFKRIMIPIRLFGSTRSFTSRAIPNRIPLHLHMRGPRLHLYNEEALISSDYIFIVESPLCCLTLKQNGINAIAKYGSSITSIDKFSKNMRVYFVPDKEDTFRGDIDTIKTSALMFSQGIKNIKVIHLPFTGEKIDVNSFFMTHDIAEFREIAKLATNCQDLPNIVVQTPQGERVYSWKKEIDSHLRKAFKPQDMNNDIVTKVKQLAHLDDIVNDYTVVQQHGNRLTARCPIHGETKPSFNIYKNPGGSDSWYCFGCANGGDVVEFIKIMEGLTFQQAVDFLCIKLNIGDEDDPK